MACSKTDTTARIIRSFQETGKKQLCREGLLNLQGMGWDDSGRVYLFSGFQVPISYLVVRFCTVSGAFEEFPLQCPLHGQFDVLRPRRFRTACAFLSYKRLYNCRNNCSHSQPWRLISPRSTSGWGFVSSAHPAGR